MSLVTRVTTGHKANKTVRMQDLSGSQRTIGISDFDDRSGTGIPDFDGGSGTRAL